MTYLQNPIGMTIGLLLLFLVMSMVQALIRKLRGDEPIRTSNTGSSLLLEPDTNSRGANWEPYLKIGYTLGWIVGVLTFAGAYIYCIVAYGFLFGMGSDRMHPAIWPLIL